MQKNICNSIANMDTFRSRSELLSEVWMALCHGRGIIQEFIVTMGDIRHATASEISYRGRQTTV